MIFGLDPLTLPAAYVLASLTCAAPAPPTVTMEFTHSPPIQRGDLSAKELGNYNISTTFSKSRNEIFTVGGITVSDFAPKYLVDFNSGHDPQTGLYCLSLKSVAISVHYAPTVFIASEFQAGTCRYKETLQHEVRHVNTDIITFNEYLPVLRAGVEAAAVRTAAAGPLKEQELLPARDRMVDALRAALAAKVDELEHVRFSRQQAIDTRQEYLRISKLCAGEPQPGR